MSDPQAPRPAGSNSEARARRRGLYGPPPRLGLNIPLTGRLVWHIGDWGRAGEHIGNRWEQVATEIANSSLGPEERLIVLADEPGLMAQMHASGLPHADALRAHLSGRKLALEPVDFKWSLETASVKQVSAETLTRVMEAELPALLIAIERVKSELGLPDRSELELKDGRFLAPEHPANRTALSYEPSLPHIVVPVDPQVFFRPLSGWRGAEAVARLESADLPSLTAIEEIERFYRLGAGITGAMVKLKTGLFDDEPATIDAAAEIEQLVRTGKARSVNAILLDLEHRMGMRRAKEEQLNNLAKLVYPFGKLKTDLQRLRVPRAAIESRGALGRAYGEITRELGTLMRAIGRELTAAGMGEDEALARLQTKHQDWAALVRARLPDIARRMTETPSESPALSSGG